MCDEDNRSVFRGGGQMSQDAHRGIDMYDDDDNNNNTRDRSTYCTSCTEFWGGVAYGGGDGGQSACGRGNGRARD